MVPSSLESSASLGTVGVIGGRRPTMQLLDYTCDYLVHLETTRVQPSSGSNRYRWECRSRVLLSCARTGEHLNELEAEAHTDR